MNCTGVELFSITCGHSCAAVDQAYVMQGVWPMPSCIECHVRLALTEQKRAIEDERQCLWELYQVSYVVWS